MMPLFERKAKQIKIKARGRNTQQPLFEALGVHRNKQATEVKKEISVQSEYDLISDSGTTGYDKSKAGKT